jgi:hypothetical protein
MAVMAVLRRRFPALQSPRKEDICYATTNRQMAVKSLRGKVDLWLVIGDKMSSNSNRLRELGADSGVPAYLVLGADEIAARVARRQADDRHHLGREHAREQRVTRSSSACASSAPPRRRGRRHPGDDRVQPAARGALTMRVALGPDRHHGRRPRRQPPRIVASRTTRAAQGAELAVFPELAICGYPPEDLLLRRGFLAAHDAALQQLAREVPPDLDVLVGCVVRNSPRKRRRAARCTTPWRCCRAARRASSRARALLPTYDVFDESRYFEPWTHPERNVVTLRGKRVGIVVCEDGWNDEHFFDKRIYAIDPVERVVQAGAELVVNLSASPWSRGKEAFRHRMVSPPRCATACRCSTSTWSAATSSCSSTAARWR